MTRILVSGYYGFGNAGDEAILAGIIRAIRSLDPGAAFTVISGKAAHTRALHGVEAISRNRLALLWEAVGEADLVISGGGSLLQDVTGGKSIPYYLGVAALGLIRRKPVMFYAQGIGPVNRAPGRWLIRLVANRVHFITVRDPESAELLRRLGVRRPPLRVTADAALALPPGERAEGQRLLAAAGAPVGRQPVVGVSVRPWPGGTDYLGELAKALADLYRRDGVVPVLIPMQPADVAQGRALAARLREQGEVPVVELGHHDYRTVQHLIAGCDAVLAMRYHALVFAAMAGVPPVGLSYDPKNDNFLRQLGLRPAGTTDAVTAPALAAAVREALGEAPALAGRLRTVMAELSARSLENARLALELIGRRGRPEGRCHDRSAGSFWLEAGE